MSTPDSILSRTQQTNSPWLDTTSLHHFPTLEEEVEVDVAIIGGGITGITTADLLKQSGKTVAVVEMGRIGQGETGHTTAHITEVLDLSYQHLIENFGIEAATLVCQSSRKAIQKIESNIAENKIECDFKRVPAWIFTEDENKIAWLKAKSASATKLGVPTSFIEAAPLPFRVRGALRFEHQARFHAVHYLYGLAQKIPGNGSYIFEKSRAIEVQDGTPCRVVTEHGAIRAKDVIVAANVPVTNRLLLHTKLAAYRSYVIAFPLDDADRMNDDLFLDTMDPYHYIRVHEFGGKKYLIVGGEDHKTGQDVDADAHFQRLQDWASKRFKVGDVTYRWSGQIINPVDGLPYIGRNSMSDHIYVATGYAGNGITFGTVAGLLLSDLILGEANPWTDIFDATRVKPWAGAKSFLSENLDFPTHLIGDRLSSAQDEKAAVIRENEGALVRMGAKKVAAYRDPEGELHLMSPVCPHMGCYVAWNNAEKSWDCPCHGSRFDPYGKLLNGPAVMDLASEEAEDDLLYVPEVYEPTTERPNPLGLPLMTFSCPCKLRPT